MAKFFRNKDSAASMPDTALQEQAKIIAPTVERLEQLDAALGVLATDRQLRQTGAPDETVQPILFEELGEE